MGWKLRGFAACDFFTSPANDHANDTARITHGELSVDDAPCLGVHSGIGKEKRISFTTIHGWHGFDLQRLIENHKHELPQCLIETRITKQDKQRKPGVASLLHHCSIESVSVSHCLQNQRKGDGPVEV